MDLTAFIEKELTGNSRNSNLVAARASIARYVANNKYSQQEIADFLNINRSTVSYYLNNYELPVDVTDSETIVFDHETQSNKESLQQFVLALSAVGLYFDEKVLETIGRIYCLMREKEGTANMQDIAKIATEIEDKYKEHE